MADIPIEDRFTSLAGTVDRHEKRLEDHKNGIKNLGEMVTKLNRKLADKDDETDEGAPPPRVCWLTLDNPVVAELVMQDLERWLHQVFIQYDRPLPACWAWHPWMVEELLALRHAHWAAYRPKASEQAAIDWHEKSLPGVVKRLGGALEMDHGLDSHRDDAARLVPVPLPGSAASVAVAWANRGEEWAFTGPRPSDLEVKEAARHTARYARRDGRRTA
jgi:hypothetical protein